MIKRIERIRDCGNGFGWSIVLIENHPVHGEEFEIAVMQNDKLCYDTDVMPDDPIRGSWDVINEVIEEIVALLGFVEWPEPEEEKEKPVTDIKGLLLFGLIIFSLTLLRMWWIGLF